MKYFIVENDTPDLTQIEDTKTEPQIDRKPNRLQMQTDSVLEMSQLVNVRFNVYITDHATLRYMQRMKITWDDLLLNSDFAQQTLFAILKKSIMSGHKFVYQNSTNGCVMVLQYTKAALTENKELFLIFNLITLFEGAYEGETNYREQVIVQGGKNSIAYDVTERSEEILRFNTAVNITFDTINIIKPEKMKYAFNALKTLRWGNNPLRVAAGCIRKTLPEIMYSYITNKLRYKEGFCCIEPKGPLNVIIFNNGFNRTQNKFNFSLSYMTCNDVPFTVNSTFNVTDANDSRVGALKQQGIKLQNVKNRSQEYRTRGNFKMAESITLTQNDLQYIINESVKRIINEASNSNIKRSMINKISKGMRPFTSKLFRDNGWENVTAAFEHMREIVGPEGQVEVTVKNGGYRNSSDGISGQNKEYHFDVFLSNGVTIGGVLTCCQAGTVQDPWSAYDMTLQMW